MSILSEIQQLRSKSQYQSPRASSSQTSGNSKYDSFVNRIYGKVKVVKVQNLIPKIQVQNQEINIPLEGAIFKKMDDYIRNEKLSQRETRNQEQLIEKEILEQYKQKKTNLLVQHIDQSYMKVLESCENFKPKFQFARYNSPQSKNKYVIQRVNELLSQRCSRNIIYKKQLEHERKWLKFGFSRNDSEKTYRLNSPLKLKNINEIIGQCIEENEGCNLDLKEINKNKMQIYKNYQIIKDHYNDFFQ